jgi:hypothetical protein
LRAGAGAEQLRLMTLQWLEKLGMADTANITPSAIDMRDD